MESFSKVWKSSKNRNKQRKYRHNAPLHMKRKMMSSPLSKELSKRYQKGAAPIITGDKVKIMRGNFKGKTGAVTEIKTSVKKVMVDSAFTLKKSGSKTFHAIDPSNLQITELNLNDPAREKSLSRKIEDNKTDKKSTEKKSDEE